MSYRKICKKIMSEGKVFSLIKPNSSIEIADSRDPSLEAQELLQNGILVETNKGLICMSLKDALRQGVGGLSLSEEDFQNVATELLFQEAPEKLIIPAAVADENGVLHLSQADKLLHIKPTCTIVESRRTVLKRKCNIPLLNDLGVAGPSTSKGTGNKVSNRTLLKAEEADSVLVSDSGLSSDTSEAVSVFNAAIHVAPVKKRGGWPKGRKRKPENKSEIRQPKAPATGYVIFLNERRKDYKDLAFTEVTKQLGNEWSRLNLEEKRRYLDQAEVDKKRYREELKSYRQSDAYRHYLQKKRQKRLQGHATEESDMDATDEVDEEDNEELYCRTCDQWFHSLHNKKEHLYGRQHLANIAGTGKNEDWPVCASLDESSLDGSRDDAKDMKSAALNMDELMIRFTAANLEKERELKSLRKKHQIAKTRHRILLETLSQTNKSFEIARTLAQTEEGVYNDLLQRFHDLFSVTAHFCSSDGK